MDHVVIEPLTRENAERVWDKLTPKRRKKRLGLHYYTSLVFRQWCDLSEHERLRVYQLLRDVQVDRLLKGVDDATA